MLAGAPSSVIANASLRSSLDECISATNIRAAAQRLRAGLVKTGKCTWGSTSRHHRHARPITPVDPDELACFHRRHARAAGRPVAPLRIPRVCVGGSIPKQETVTRSPPWVVTQPRRGHSAPLEHPHASCRRWVSRRKSPPTFSESHRGHRALTIATAGPVAASAKLKLRRPKAQLRHGTVLAPGEQADVLGAVGSVLPCPPTRSQPERRRHDHKHEDRPSRGATPFSRSSSALISPSRC
jgi:hypothetical protein